jgi:UDP:flavonoid glycosyltransferase YjiC (YdhE family)
LAAGACALLVVRNLPPELKRAYTSDQMHFSETLVDLSQVAKEAAWAINHANINTATVFVKAGIPQLLIPRHQEQLFVALRMVDHGSAVLAYQDQPGFAKEIDALLTQARYRECAVQLQAQCAATGLTDAAGFIRKSLNDWMPRS